MIHVGPTACWVPCDTGQRSRSPGFSRDSCSRAGRERSLYPDSLFHDRSRMTDRTGGRANIPMTNPFQTVSENYIVEKFAQKVLY